MQSADCIMQLLDAFPDNLKCVICKYTIIPPKKIKDWVLREMYNQMDDQKSINFSLTKYLNDMRIHAREYYDMIAIFKLSQNPAAVYYLKNHPEHICWDSLSTNIAAIPLLLANKDKINWESFSINPNPDAIEFLRQNPEYIEWEYFVQNTSAAAIEYMRENMDKLPKYLDKLTANYAAQDLAEEVGKSIDPAYELPPSESTQYELIVTPEIQPYLSSLNAYKEAHGEYHINGWYAEFYYPWWAKVTLDNNLEKIPEFQEGSDGMFGWYLSINPDAIDFIKENLNYFDPYSILLNKNTFEDI